MTQLRKMMLEELQRRNYSETTIDCYIRVVEDFSRRFHLPPTAWVLGTFANTKPNFSKSRNWQRPRFAHKNG